MKKNKQTEQNIFICHSYRTIFRPIVESANGSLNVLNVKKVLTGLSEYIEALNRHTGHNNKVIDVVKAIKTDYKIHQINIKI